MLSGKRLRKLLSARGNGTKDRLVVWPMFDLDAQVEDAAASIDLHLGTRFAAAKRRRIAGIRAYGSILDDEEEARGGAAVAPPQDALEEYYVPVGDTFVLHPRHFVLAQTLEWVKLPANLGAYITTKSTLARMGLNIATAVGIHPTFAGTITLEMANLADVPIEVRVGQPIGQVFFHRIEDPANTGLERTAFVGLKRPLVRSLTPGRIEKFLWHKQEGKEEEKK
jgi:dCTP deaminase